MAVDNKTKTAFRGKILHVIKMAIEAAGFPVYAIEEGIAIKGGSCIATVKVTIKKDDFNLTEAIDEHAKKEADRSERAYMAAARKQKSK